MSTVIGNLRVMLGLDSSSFQQGMDRSLGRFQEFGRKMRVAALGIAGAGAAGFAAFNNSATRMADLQKQADIAGLSAEQFKIAALAAEQYGVGQEKLSDILKDVNDKFGEFAATGGGELKDFFDTIAPKVGLTIDSFKDLSSSDALKLYVTALQDAGVSQAQMTFYMEALANDATGLVPVFGNAGAAIDQMAKRAKELGLSIDEGMIASSREAQGDIRLISEVLRTQFDGAILKLAPSLSRFAKDLMTVASEVSNLVNKTQEWTAKAGPAVRRFIDEKIAMLGELGPRAREKFDGLITATSEALTGWADQARSWAQGVVRAIVEGLAGLYQAGLDAIRELGRGMRESVTGLIESAKSWGSDIAAGVSAGVARARSKVTGAVKDMGRAISDTFTSDKEIQSPSREFMRFGEFIGDGLSLGIDTSARGVKESIQRVADGVTSVLEDAAFRGGSIMEGLRNLVGSILGNAAGGLFQQGLGGLFGAIGIPGFAAGVQNFKGGWARINEAGAELVKLPGGSTVVPHGLSERMMDRGGDRGPMQVSIGFDRTVGSLTATMRDVAGNVVSEATPRIVGQSVGATRTSIRKSKSGWGIW